MAEVNRKCRTAILGPLFFSIFLCLNCASTEMMRFRENIQRMSDAELMACYHGINERLKDIDHRVERKGQPGNTEKPHLISRQTYFIGGESYGLMQKEKIVLQEMRNRNIFPP